MEPNLWEHSLSLINRGGGTVVYEELGVTEVYCTNHEDEGLLAITYELHRMSSATA